MQLRQSNFAICLNAVQDSRTLLHVSMQLRTVELGYTSQRGSGLLNLAACSYAVQDPRTLLPVQLSYDAVQGSRGDCMFELLIFSLFQCIQDFINLYTFDAVQDSRIVLCSSVQFRTVELCYMFHVVRNHRNLLYGSSTDITLADCMFVLRDHRWRRMC